MSRPRRIDFARAWHHAMARSAGDREIFGSDDDRNSFLGLLGEIHTRFAVQVHAYCLMGTHYHLLLHTPKANLAKAMRRLNGMHTQRFNHHNNTEGPLFRGRYKSLVIDADRYLLAVSRYIHRNPVEAGIVATPIEYPWSSFGAYVELHPGPPWLHTELTLRAMAGPSQRDAYRSFVEARAADENPAELYESRSHPQILGRSEFVRSLTTHAHD